MPQTDKQGRPYASIDTLKPGQTVWLDGGFTCHRPGPVVVLFNGDSPYFLCEDGDHYLDGQLDDDGPYLIGVYSADPGPLRWEQE